MASNIESIPEVQPVNVYVDSDHELEELQEKMDYICQQNAGEFYKMKIKMAHINTIFENNFNTKTMNKNFDDHELFEEQIDELIHEYIKVKELMKHGREIRLYTEKKKQQKSNELRYARNLLAHFGIDPIT